jgi:microcystin-dependent protein
MGEPYIGEIRMFGGNFAPAGWMFCEGQLLPIAENETLFALIGTTYGGDGQSTFALPDLQGRIPLHQGTGSSGSTYILGENGGVEAVALTVNQIPIHQHTPLCNNNAGTLTTPTNAFWAGAGAGFQMYSQPTSAHTMHPGAIAVAGGNQPHDNFGPYLCVNFIISLFGVFPPPN